ncbi:MAG TPA: glycoside hydrolase family 15 protein [Candidatus Saccharimonadales bacterium]|nr:glycoside hydrolase family 15 protein [Candidatus Saccharimonadales bacterium]
MGRPVVLSNGQLFVGLDEFGLVHDFYYPYVGLENLTTARSTQHKIGVWVDGEFSWTDDGSWNIEVNFESTALISSIHLQSKKMGIELFTQDFVDVEYNALIRRIEIRNNTDRERDIRLFMHQVFEISRRGRSDTALFVPEERYLLDYKGRYCLLIAGKQDDHITFDEYAVGNYGIENKLGTFVDAEDGELSGNSVEHGGVDSVLRFKQTLSAKGTSNVDYWIIAGASQTDIEIIHTLFKGGSITDRLNKCRTYWKAWLKPCLDRAHALPEQERVALFKSLLVIKAHCDERGSVLASGDSSIYNYGRDYYCYCWPRDAAYAVWPLIRLGFFEEARRFFAFARDTMHPDGYLMHKYQPDRAIGSTWHPLVHGKHSELAIQEDETAGVVFMINEYYEASNDKQFVENLFHTFIEPCANFMAKFIDDATGLPHASYDLWEQVFLTTTYSTCVTIAGLEAAAKLAEAFDHPEAELRWQKAADGIRSHLDGLYDTESGYFRRGQLYQSDEPTVYNDLVDISSLYGPFMYAQLPLENEYLRSTATEVERQLLNKGPIGGVIRYPGDDYFLEKTQYGGNPWIVCSLWLAQYYLACGRENDAQTLLNWALERRLNSGILSEQFDPENGAPLGVAPLVWSHAELINTLIDFYKI